MATLINARCPWSRRLQPVWEEAYMNVMKTEHANDVLFAKALHLVY